MTDTTTTVANSTVGTGGGGHGVTALAAGGTAGIRIGSHLIPDKFDLSQHASLVRVKISAWGATVKNVEAAEDAASAAGADLDFFTATMRHVSKDHPLKRAVDVKVNEARNWYKDNTSFWDGGGRLVTNLQYTRVMGELQRMRAEFLQAVEAFLNGLPELEAIAAAKQGRHAGRFPPRSELERRFAFEIVTTAIANPNDIRLKHVSAETAKEIEDATRAMQAKQVTEVMGRLVVRISNAVENFTNQMGSASQGYHKTAVDNMVELAAIIPELNLTQDPGINAVAKKMAETFANVTVKELKANPEKRAEITAKAGDLLAKVKSMTVTDVI